MLRYENLGNAIEVNIKDEFYIVAFINLTNKEKSEYKCDLYIKDKEVGFMTEINQTPTIGSDPKSVKIEVFKNISKLIENNYFDDDIEYVKRIYAAMENLKSILKEN